MSKLVWATAKSSIAWLALINCSQLAWCQSDVVSINRMPEDDIRDRIAFISNMLSTPKLDSIQTLELNRLRASAGDIAALNYECKGISINDIPNPRCKQYYLVELPKFEEAFSKATGNFYSSRIVVSASMTNKRNAINQCVNALPSFLNPEFSPQNMAKIEIKSMEASPLSDSTIEVHWKVSSKIDMRLANTFKSRLGVWKKNCLDLVSDTAIIDGRKKFKWSPYFLSQSVKAFQNTQFVPVNGKIWYRAGWVHRVSLNGRMISTIENPSFSGPYIDLLSGIEGGWDDNSSGRIVIPDDSLVGIVEPIIARKEAYVDSFVDKRDGNVYPTTTIGSQIWMARNLSYKTKNSVCASGEENCDISGRYYDFLDAQTACPSGWRMPTKKDHWDLAKTIRLTKLPVSSLISNAPWGMNASYGTNISGLNLMPTGSIENGKISNAGNYAFLWAGNDIIRASPEEFITIPKPSEFSSIKYSMRCIKD